MDVQDLYRQKRVLKAQWRKAAREGTLACQEGPMIPRHPSEITEMDQLNNDLVEPLVWITTLPNINAGMIGGKTTLSKIDTAAQNVIFGANGSPAIRLATVEEVEREKKRQQDLLNERIATARNLSIKDDARYGKRA